jgi:hypothetical protein
LRTEIIHLFHSESFDHGASGGAHESWRFDVTVWGMDGANASQTVFMMDVEL